MDIAIFNGSPRYKKSNSKILADKFIEGFKTMAGSEIPVYYLAQTKQREENVNAFLRSKINLFIFPLYTDSMPGIVKLFIEDIIQLTYTGEKKIGFIVQSGFPEGIHCQNLEMYLKKLSRRIRCDYLGTVTKGGVEGIQVMPPFMKRKLFNQFFRLGQVFAQTDELDKSIINELKKPYKMNWLRRTIFRFFAFTGLSNFYWNSNLKKNNAWKKRFATPFREIISE
jgi:NAD(P)H-dependent FMN reductase